MSLLQLFINAIKGEPPPPPVVHDGLVGIAAFPATNISIVPAATAEAHVEAVLTGSVDVQVLARNPA